MKRFWVLTVGLLVLTGIEVASADVLLIITTDSDLNDNGGVDQFAPVPVDGLPHTIYIWGAATPDTETLFEFNFDLSLSGQSLSFGNAMVGPLFTSLSGSLSDTDLDDLQFGWAVFFGTPPVLSECPAYTLFATVDVAISPQAQPGLDTTIDLGGPDFRILAASGTEPVSTATYGLSRDLRSVDAVPNCTDLDGICGDGVIQEGEDCDPPDGVTCDAECIRIPRCGDGFLDPAETCDDGNTLPADGCDASCQLEDLLNDDCVDAIPIFDGQTVFYTIEATTDGPAHANTCQFDGQTYHDIWYDYTASCTGEVTMRLCESDYDTDLVVYDGCACPASGVEVLACNDDGCPGSPPGAYRSQVTVPVILGACYRIRVGGWALDDAGAGVIEIVCDRCEGDEDCDDGLFCTGVETCLDGRCHVESFPCEGQVCDEEKDACVPAADGDVDRDGDVDWNDLAAFVRCRSGPGNVLPQCTDADFDDDGDVDLGDFCAVQTGFTGPRP